MSNIAYPLWIPKAGEEAEFEKGAAGVLVKDEASYRRLNLKHFEETLAYVPPTPMTMNQAVANERERCAVIAEAYGNTQTAIAIRGAGLPPTLELVMAAGYNEDAAQQIVAEEKVKYAAGYPPYGTNTPPPGGRITASPAAEKLPPPPPPAPALTQTSAPPSKATVADVAPAIDPFA